MSFKFGSTSTVLASQSCKSLFSLLPLNEVADSTASDYSNSSQATRTIIFNTKSHLARNFGILIAWAILSIITVTLISILTRRQEVAASASAEATLSNKKSDMVERRMSIAESHVAEGIDHELEKEIEEANRLDRVAGGFRA